MILLGRWKWPGGEFLLRSARDAAPDSAPPEIQKEIRNVLRYLAKTGSREYHYIFDRDWHVRVAHEPHEFFAHLTWKFRDSKDASELTIDGLDMVLNFKPLALADFYQGQNLPEPVAKIALDYVFKHDPKPQDEELEIRGRYYDVWLKGDSGKVLKDWIAAEGPMNSTRVVVCEHSIEWINESESFLGNSYTDARTVSVEYFRRHPERFPYSKEILAIISPRA